jgi:Immunity protein 26
VTRSRARKSYQEGDWFAVPLRNGGYAIGLIARGDGKGIVLGYFFGPRREHVPSLDSVKILRRDQATLVTRFGDPGLRSGYWPIIGRAECWRREEWPLPLFARIDMTAQRAWVSRYDEETLRCVDERTIDIMTAKNYPADLLSGYGAVEIKLTRLFP